MDAKRGRTATADCQTYLAGVGYPCGREELLRHAAAHGAGDEILGQLGTLPIQDYDCLDTVCDTLDARATGAGT